MAISLSEAFESLYKLDEEVYDFSDEGIDEMKTAIPEFDDELEVIDPEAETEEDLQGSYLGKVILNCPVCNNLIYQGKEDIEFDEDDEELVNVDKECPYCYTTGGFSIVGEVAPYTEEGDIEVKVDGEEVEVEDSDDEDDDDEALNLDKEFDYEDEHKDEEDEEDDEKFESLFSNKKPLSEGLKLYMFNAKFGDELANRLFKCACKEGECKTLEELYAMSKEELEAYLDKACERNESLEVTESKSLNEAPEGYDYSGLETDYTRRTETWEGMNVNSAIYRRAREFFSKTVTSGVSTSSLFSRLQDWESSCHKGFERAIGRFWPESWEEANSLFRKVNKKSFEQAESENFPIFFHKELNTYGNPTVYTPQQNRPQEILLTKQSSINYFFHIYDSLEDFKHWFTPEVVVAAANNFIRIAYEVLDEELKKYGAFADEKVAIEEIEDAPELESLEKKYTKVKNVTEGFTNVDIDTDDQHLHMDQDETGKTTVTTEPLNKEAEFSEAEMIAPVSDETKDEILGGEERGADDFATDELGELPAEGDFDDFAPEESEEDIEDIDEESLDVIGESFLKGIYSNVTGYKTSRVSSKGNSLIAEGIIDFASGKSKKTSFIFEADTCENGKDCKKVKFKGYNKEIHKGKKALSLNGTLKGKNLTVESLSYNYVQKDKNGKARRLTGTVKK